MSKPAHTPRSWFYYYRWLWPALVIAALALAAVFASVIAPQDPWDLRTLELEDSNLPPPWTERGQAERMIDGELDGRFFLGTDEQGRDVFSAILYGLRVSFFVGITATLLASVVGVALGLAAGYFGGRFDAFIMRLADIQLSFPSVLIALFLMAVLGQSTSTGGSMVTDLSKIIFAVAVVHWVIYARMARGMVLTEREKDYISAVRALGARTPRIMFLHLLPNITGPIVVISAIEFASIVILEATLSYLGLGVPITRPSLGMLIKFGYDNFFSGQWWVWFFPGLALVVLVFSINLLADILRSIYSIGNY